MSHKQDFSNLQHFDGVKFFILDNCNTVDIIIGNDNAFLMSAMEERMGESRDESHAIFIPLGRMASEGRSPIYMPGLLRFLECKPVWLMTICRSISLTWRPFIGKSLH